MEKSNNLQALEEALRGLEDGERVVLVSGHAERRREALQRRFTRILGQWFPVVVCSPLSSYKFRNFCDLVAGEQGLKLDERTLEYLGSFTGDRAGLAAQEIKRLATAGKGSEAPGAAVSVAAEFRWVDDLLRQRVLLPT